MREVKEKSPLKERAAETLKSTPQAAFRRGTDASFQQLRQELRDAAQDGQPEDCYESGKITDTADHAVQEARQGLLPSAERSFLVGFERSRDRNLRLPAVLRGSPNVPMLAKLPKNR